MPTRLWWRLVELLAARGELDAYTERIAKHLAWHATAAGYLKDIEADDGAVLAYRNRFGIGRRTFYTDLERLKTVGLLRQTRAACPGRPVGYQLCAPPTLPPDLPAGLGRELRKLWGRLRDEDQDDVDEAERRTPAAADAVKVRLPVVERHALLAQCETVRLGSARRVRLYSECCRGGLHTSPYLQRALSHPLRRADAPPDPPPRHSSLDRSSDEDELVEEVLRKCDRAWRRDRGPSGGLDGQAAVRLTPLVRGALRYLTSADVVETMTRGTATARSVGAVVATRLRAVILAGRRAAQIPVDDNGHHYRARQDAYAAMRRELHDTTAAARAAVRAQLAAVRTRQAHSRAGQLHTDRPARTLTAVGATEPEAEFARQLADTGFSTPAPGGQAPTAEQIRELQWAIHNATRSARRRGDQPPLLADALEQLPDHLRR